MTLRNQFLIWIGLFAATILLIWVFRSILLPFVVGLAIAYLLNPVVNLLQKAKIPRPLGALMVLILVLAIIVGLILALVPLVARQVGSLISLLPGYVTDIQELLQEWAPQLADWLGPERTAQLESSLADLLGRAVELAGVITATLAASGATVINTIAVVFITPVVGYYLLVDWERMVQKGDDLLPRQHREEIRGVLQRIDSAMAGVLRGQGSVILVLCIFYATALSLVGLNFGLSIGLIGGLLSFIPFVGFLVGFVLSTTVAIVQFWPDQWVLILVVLTIYMVGQFLEGNVLYPKLVGSSININPVWLMFALFAFGLLFGFVGLLLAVPLAAIAGVLTRYALDKYRASTLYRGLNAEALDATLIGASDTGTRASLIVPEATTPRSKRASDQDDA